PARRGWSAAARGRGRGAGRTRGRPTCCGKSGWSPGPPGASRRVCRAAGASGPGGRGPAAGRAWVGGRSTSPGAGLGKTGRGGGGGGGGAGATGAVRGDNVAGRLGRGQGEGIYRDSGILGRPVPIQNALVNAQVTGQDSGQTAV